MQKSEKEQIKSLQSRLSEVKVKSMIKLLEGSTIISDYMSLKLSLDEIENQRHQKSPISDCIISTHTDMCNNILKGRKEEEVYRDACKEYFDICALLFQ